MLYELLYTSVAAKELSDAELAGLLDQSRTNNQHFDITGLLIYHNREFAQLLEGEKQAVLDLFDRISEDRRHVAVGAFWEGPIKQRNFLQWRMAFIHSESVATNHLKGAAAVFEKGISLKESLLSNGRNIGKDLVLNLAGQILPLEIH